MNKNEDIMFLYKKVNMSRSALAYWITNDEFAAEIRKLKGSNTTISERVVFDIMQRIYKAYVELRAVSEQKPDFNYRLAKKGLSSLWFSMTGKRDGWDNT